MLQGASGLINHGSHGGKLGKAYREEMQAESFPSLCWGCAVNQLSDFCVPQFLHTSGEDLDSPLRIACMLTEFLAVSLQHLPMA